MASPNATSLCAFAFVVVAACGARTGLGVGREIVTDAGCTNDETCDDHIACTLDRCDTGLGVCTHTLRDNLCDDGLFCDGVERCDVSLGCVATAPSCDDGIACTNESCDEPKKKCEHEPDNSKCPISQACNPTSGCEQRAFVHDFDTLYDVRLPSGVITTIGSTSEELTDVALDPNNVLFGISFGELETVNQSTGLATPTQSFSSQSLNGADFGPDGTLFVAGDNSLFTLDTKSGTLTTVAMFPAPLQSSGDIAFVGARLLATGGGSEESDELVEFDLTSGTGKVIGPVGFNCVWGLASYGASLYGFTCSGEILTIDTSTGHATLLKKLGAMQFWGASAR